MKGHSVILSIGVWAVFALDAGAAWIGEGKAEGVDLGIDLGADVGVGVVETEGGLVEGYVERGVYVYKGIPYGKARRFMPPEKADAWEGVRSCRAYGPVCPQGTRSAWKDDRLAFAFDWNDGHPGEDCLRLNVWTPAIGDGGGRAVMVWMHPGGYTGGSSYEMPCFDGTNLALRHDVVVVSFNHRLNELGFLDLSAYGEKYAESANVGMLDAVAALQWVRDNISAFGGDPENVTIFGQSGGGGKVATLMAMPSARGLFRRAIVQSGSMINTMERRYSRMIADSTLKNLGLRPSEVDKLSKMPYETLHRAGQKAIKQVRPIAEAEGARSFIFGWAPVVDSLVLPFQPSSAEAMALSSDIPLIVGCTRKEFPNTVYSKRLREPDMEMAMKYLNWKFGGRGDEFARLYEAAYGEASPEDLVDLDLEFRPNVLNHARLKAAAGGAPVYVYMFDLESPVLDGYLRSVHCSEIPYVFDNAELQWKMTGGGAGAQALADIMSGAWTAFAKTGTPVADGLPEWEPYDPDSEATMHFDTVCHITHGHDRALVDFITSFPTRGITTLQ